MKHCFSPGKFDSQGLNGLHAELTSPPKNRNSTREMRIASRKPAKWVTFAENSFPSLRMGCLDAHSKLMNGRWVNE